MIDSIIEKYKQAAIKYGEFTGVNSRKANKQHDIMINCYLQLRELKSLESIKALLTNENDNVKLWAGSHLLAVAPEEAEKVLSDLSQKGGLLSYSAMATLEQWNKGRLSFTYDNYNVSW